ncbi:hypothetical protein [Natrononativus amylolyticus]|uniref:hypothetical protein n=1 Tax=Natrononativus amylolyticus TaxID=2963434 RepID=UPI0020CCBD14|nr:hypothetical protein [Natrononativus amylolyticus]
MTEAEQALTGEEFTRQLGVLLERAERDGITFDRSWTVSSGAGTDLMVEITRVRSRDR